MNYFFISYAKDLAQGFGNQFYATPQPFHIDSAQKYISLSRLGGLKVAVLFWRSITKEEFEHNATPDQIKAIADYEISTKESPPKGLSEPLRIGESYEADDGSIHKIISESNYQGGGIFNSSSHSFLANGTWPTEGSLKLIKHLKGGT